MQIFQLEKLQYLLKHKKQLTLEGIRGGGSNWCGFKHRASLYLKFEGLNLSIVIIFKTFHWLKNDESYSVVSVTLPCVSLLLRQQKVILCYEMTFLIIAELTYSCFTYQIIIVISLIPSIPDFVYIHFAQKNALNC